MAIMGPIVDFLDKLWRPVDLAINDGSMLDMDETTPPSSPPESPWSHPVPERQFYY